LAFVLVFLAGLLVLMGPKVAQSEKVSVGNCYADTVDRSTPTVCE
jgi:hypothetical protein